MAQNIYLKLDGIEGESTSKQGEKQIELLSFSHGVSMPISSGHASGVSVKHGRCDHQDLTVSKYLDKTSPTLNLNCSGGTNIKTAVLTVWQADAASGDPIEHYKIELEDILITSMSVGGSGGDNPVETITLHYNKIKWTYAVHAKDAPGGKKGNVTTGWDLEKNVKV
jgi:type VI secretion system secreted protein Hcp